MKSNEGLDYKRILDFYFHVDNGGYQFKYDIPLTENAIYNGLIVENSFFGYAHNIIMMPNMTAAGLRELGAEMLAAADRLDTFNKENML